MRNVGEENTPGRPKSDDFGRTVSRMAVAQICERVGFDGFKKSALDSLSDITIQYLSDLGKTASFYANLSGRTRCHFFDIARSFEDILIGVSQGFLGASSSDNCLVNSGTIKELIDFVGSTDEIPFVQPVPRFPVIRDRKLIPTFEKMSEVPPGKHIPAWLPALPDPHTYLHTPTWNERLLDPRAEKVEQARQRIKAERALLSLQKRMLSNGSAGASSSGISDNIKEPGAVYSSQFLAMPLESGKKDVSPAKILWIGPVKFKFSGRCSDGASKLTQALNELRKRNCDITVVGNMACKAMVMESKSVLVNDMIENASVLWEFFKGRKLPGVMALDRAYPFEIDWKSAYSNPAQPLVVDIGSGSGLFLLGMARRRKDLNFLGLEINTKLVRRCMDSVHQYGIQNGYFIVTNATTTFRSIVSSYPGELVLVSIQCPNPDFNNPEHRWRMLKSSLIKAVVDLLALDGKVFLQSDIKAVALRMKELFLKNGKGKLNLWNDQYHAKMNLNEWLEENPFGVMSDWEQHVIGRGDPMYRLMLSKSSGIE